MKKIINDRRKFNNKVLKKSLTHNISSMTGCSKGFVNGPCGSFFNGKCEVINTKDCVWVLIYEKLKSSGKLEEFVNKYVEPKKQVFKYRK
ncbi:MAG: methylenetetrahydrofolate reductase C-terminal domain-containing protein [Endomicrobium sp.]|jgi:hypothetical protein|nr:methylenetetrahydrofolate reductase C-terminal domain-containing protein [Endomicrobium sp.]